MRNALADSLRLAARLSLPVVVPASLLLASQVGAQPPSIVVHPDSVYAATGDSVVLRVTATGAPPLAYQWRLNDQDIPGATDSIYRILDAHPPHTGFYRVRVSNPLGSAVSRPAVVAVFEDCGQETQVYLARARDPASFQRLQEIEEAAYDSLYPEPRLPLRDYCIPLVVHVIHDNGPENITDQQVHSAIRQLNEDFRRIPNTPGFGAGVDTRISFHLAQRDPAGNPTTGIVRVQSSQTITILDGNGPGEQALKSLSHWPNDRYLNVWVVRCIDLAPPKQCPPGTGGVLGWAWLGVNPTVPSKYDLMDGIVVRHDRFGRVGTAAGAVTRVLTHEAGHWLLLHHTFRSPGCFAGVECGTAPTHAPPNCGSTGDYCCDTPPQTQHFSCAPGTNTCALDVPDCPDPIRNYLSYSHGCQNELTAHQRARMHYWLTDARTRIWSDDNLAATGLPCFRICGTKFADLDHDGVRDAGESGLPGWAIVLGGPVSAVAITDATGRYCFENLPPGTYTVTEATQPGTVLTAPPGGSYTVTVPPDALNLDFGNHRCALQPCARPPAGLVAWWPLDEPDNSTVAHDIQGGNDGQWTGNPVPVNGQHVGNSRNFATGGDYVRVPDNSALDFGTGDFSIDAWVRLSAPDAGVRTVVDKRAGSIAGAVGYLLFLTNDRLGFQMGDTGHTNWVAPLGSQLAAGRWYHVAVTVRRTSPTGGSLYVNGTSVLTFDPTVRPGSISNGSPLHVGQQAIVPRAFNGDIDEVQLFSRALRPGEVNAIHESGMDGKCKKLCRLPSIRTFGPNQASLQVCFNIVNSDFSQQKKSFTWTLAGLPPSPPTCTAFGPIAFSPAAGSLTLQPGGNAATCVTIGRPGGLAPGQTACYQLTVLDETTGRCFTCTGRLGASWKWDPTDMPDHAIPAPDTGAVPVTFTIGNDDAPGIFRYRITSRTADGDPDSQVVSLDGRPPGVPVEGERPAGPNETFDISVSARGGINTVIVWPELVMEWDLDGDGLLDEASAVGLLRGAPVLPVPEPPPVRLEGPRAFPNPFETGTSVRFALPAPGRVEVRVYDVNGRLVRTLHAGRMEAGSQVVPWDGRDARGARPGAGIYFIRIRSGERTLAVKVARLK